MRIEEKFSFTWSGNLETGRVQCIIAGLHVGISRHKKVLYLNVFSWGLLLNNGEKNTVVLNNSRRLRISHHQRNTAEFLRIPYFRVVPP